MQQAPRMTEEERKRSVPPSTFPSVSPPSRLRWPGVRERGLAGWRTLVAEKLVSELVADRAQFRGGVRVGQAVLGSAVVGPTALCDPRYGPGGIRAPSGPT
jgi:hypothetical protein